MKSTTTNTPEIQANAPLSDTERMSMAVHARLEQLRSEVNQMEEAVVNDDLWAAESVPA